MNNIGEESIILEFYHNHKEMKINNLKNIFFLNILTALPFFVSAQTLEKFTSLQRTYGHDQQISRTIQDYSSTNQAAREAPSPPMGQLLSEEVIEVTVWKEHDDTFAMATVMDRKEYDALHTSLSSRSSPKNLTSDIRWTGSGSDAAANVVSAYNHAREEENKQLGNNPSLMVQEHYPASGGNELSLWLANDDRSSRGVLPFEGIEASVQEIAEGHMNDMLENNFFGHTGTNGRSPFARIDAHPKIGRNKGPNGVDCHEFLPRGENLAAFWSSNPSIALVRELSQYNFVYNDASSAWGHRECALLGDRDLRGGKGFSNNVGNEDSEGYVGFAVGGSGGFNPYNFSWARYGEILVFNMIDPVPNCEYTVLNASTEDQQSDFVQVVATVSEDATSVTLSWEVRHDNKADVYQVEYRPANESNWTLAGNLSSKTDANAAEEAVLYSYDITGLDPGSYEFRIIKTNSDNTQQTSAIAKGTIPDPTADNGDDPQDKIEAKDVRARIESGALVFDTPGRLLITIADPLGRATQYDYSPGDRIALSGLQRGIHIIRVMNPSDRSLIMTLRLWIR